MAKKHADIKIVRTADFDRALEALECGAPFTFITGRAGTGKSTLLKEFRRKAGRRCVVLAPTGVAALNVDGETIHGFFRFGPGISTRDARKKGQLAAGEPLYLAFDLIIIDEISMVRADLLDAVDMFLRGARQNQRPFGGARVAVIGDLFQLPPVLSTEERDDFARVYGTPFFFGSDAFGELVERHEVAFVELNRVFRQVDQKFIGVLNAVRANQVEQKHLDVLRTRVKPPHEDAIILTSINTSADAINKQRLRALPGGTTGYEGYAQGSFGERDMPTSSELLLKPGARVMFIANDAEGRYVNGTVGTVKTCEPKYAVVETDDGEEIEVGPHTWTLYRSVYDQKSKSLGHEKLGSFTQVPLRLAWAVTIHKSQGKTFDRVHIDLGRGAFASGQTYVGLSRARSLNGLTLAAPVEHRHILVDERVISFFDELPEMLRSGARKGGTFSMNLFK